MMLNYDDDVVYLFQTRIMTSKNYVMKPINGCSTRF